MTPASRPLNGCHELICRRTCAVEYLSEQV